MKIHNSVAKQKLLTEMVFGSPFQFAGIYYYQQYTKPFNSEIKWNKRNQTFHMCHENGWKAAYLLSYLASCFKRVSMNKI